MSIVRSIVQQARADVACMLGYFPGLGARLDRLERERGVSYLQLAAVLALCIAWLLVARTGVYLVVPLMIGFPVFKTFQSAVVPEYRCERGQWMTFWVCYAILDYAGTIARLAGFVPFRGYYLLQVVLTIAIVHPRVCLIKLFYTSTVRPVTKLCFGLELGPADLKALSNTLASVLQAKHRDQLTPADAMAILCGTSCLEWLEAMEYGMKRFSLGDDKDSELSNSGTSRSTSNSTSASFSHATPVPVAEAEDTRQTTTDPVNQSHGGNSFSTTEETSHLSSVQYLDLGPHPMEKGEEENLNAAVPTDETAAQKSATEPEHASFAQSVTADDLSARSDASELEDTASTTSTPERLPSELERRIESEVDALHADPKSRKLIAKKSGERVMSSYESEV